MLVATDLDGTLVPKDSFTIPDYTARVLREVDAAGIPVVFITGRPLRWVEPLREHVGEHGIAIVSNGALTYDLHANRIERIRGIEPEIGLAIARDIAAALPTVQLAIEFPAGIRLTPEFEQDFPMAGAPCGTLADLWSEPAIKLLAKDPSIDHDALRDGTLGAVADRATATWSMPGLIEISARGITKANALAALCEKRGIDAADVIAFGDMPNDIPMLTWAGTAYAMADAHDSVLAVADHIAPSCQDEGVAQTLETLLTTSAR